MTGLHSPAADTLPPWVPQKVRLYLSHTEDGVSLRALARRSGLNASTVLRQVRRYEARRDDPLMDGALEALSAARETTTPKDRKDQIPMTAPVRATTMMADDAQLLPEARRVLRRLAEPGAVLVFSPEMEKAVVLREYSEGRSTRTAVLDRTVAQAFSLRDWIACKKVGRVSAYEITATGRMALKRILAEETGPRAGVAGFAETAMPFADQHREMGEISLDEGEGRARINLIESPVAVLGRRRDKDGKPFLDPSLVEAAERLREDFELAQMGPRITQNWERFLTAGERRGSARTAVWAKGRCTRANGWRRRCATLGRGWGMLLCGCAASLRGWRRRSAVWDGLRGLARWCCASR